MTNPIAARDRTMAASASPHAPALIKAAKADQRAKSASISATAP